MELASPKAVACIVVLITVTVALALGLAHSPLAGDARPAASPATQKRSATDEESGAGNNEICGTPGLQLDLALSATEVSARGNFWKADPPVCGASADIEIETATSWFAGARPSNQCP